MTTACGRHVQDDLVASECDLEQCSLLYCTPEVFTRYRRHVRDSIVDRGRGGNSSSKSFLTYVDECVSERESKAFWKGLDIKTKLHMYKRFVRQSEFKKYLHGFCDAGTRLLFKFRSGMHGLNEELGRHRGKLSIM